MKIRVVLCIPNKKYINRLQGYYESHYDKLDTFDIHMFSDIELAKEYLKSHEADVFLVDEKSEIDLSQYEDTLCAYLVDDNSVESINDRKAIGKYQKADSLFKTIFSYYAENNEAGREYRFSSEPAKVYLFQNAGGGTGCTTVAMAFADAMAEKGKKVLYLNLEQEGFIEHVYQSETGVDFGEILYMVKRNPGNLAMKLMASVTQDRSGVFFIKPSNNIPDMLEVTAQDMEVLISTLKRSCDFEAIVIDKAAGLSETDRVNMDHASSIFFVLEASEISQRKFVRYIGGMQLLDESGETRNASKIKILFNKYRSKQQIFSDIEYEILGGIPHYDNMSMPEIVSNISRINLLNKME